MWELAWCPPFGVTTSVSTWLSVLLSSSSQVMKSTPSDFHALDAVIAPTSCLSQSSPTETAQLCVSWHMSGVIQLNRGVADARSEACALSGTTLEGQAPP